MLASDRLKTDPFQTKKKYYFCFVRSYIFEDINTPNLRKWDFFIKNNHFCNKAKKSFCGTVVTKLKKIFAEKLYTSHGI